MNDIIEQLTNLYESLIPAIHEVGSQSEEGRKMIHARVLLRRAIRILSEVSKLLELLN